MKYRISGIILAIIILIIYGTAIQPRLDLENPWINLVSLVIMFTVLAVLGTIARKMDKR
ncbi:hypothetical protein JTZ62_04800 [Mammaliicoccus sciuri]|uniref:hypothetical protein n=1 Tax=Mammaliicoccus sciuri TaxID=1296 RepID=UPI0019D3D547|nr:hypothetical protein [Mammaliicoccus sciuri]MEB6232549.1 hypothetical protein [Mammaliicoccus sciuri]QSN68478.1 hypothetical protein JTZ62_04800 [Mammaliicoccus sciuri]UIU23219.1 hypothetical protein LLZ87_04810 [Mammaliicoccus sciuri]UIU26124.1 hypothetical protein LLZ92_04810 [Mammaliicoccus sciuri]